MNILKELSIVIIPICLLFILVGGIIKKVNLYDEFCAGAKSGLQLTVNILPYLCAMMVAISIIRSSGILDKLSEILSKPLSFLGIPIEIISLFLIRPFSGSAALSMLVDIFNSTGVNSLTSDIASTMMGATETTFYTIALYFGAIGIKKTRYTIAVAFVCDVLSMLISVFICRLIL